MGFYHLSKKNCGLDLNETWELLLTKRYSGVWTANSLINVVYVVLVTSFGFRVLPGSVLPNRILQAELTTVPGVVE